MYLSSEQLLQIGKQFWDKVVNMAESRPVHPIPDSGIPLPAPVPTPKPDNATAPVSPCGVQPCPLIPPAAPKYAISQTNLEALFPDAKSEHLATLVNEINTNGEKFGITDCDKLSHYLAQAGHETGGFTKDATIESTYYTSADRVKVVFGENSNIYKGVKKEEDRIIAATLAKEKNIPPNKYLKNQENFANLAYANKIGNGDEASGDGDRFRGRGYFQLTGRENYTAFQTFYNEAYGKKVDFVKDPSLVASDNNYAVVSSLWFFKEKTLPKIESGSSFSVITKSVNAKGVGLEEREKIYNDSKKIFCGK